MKPVRHWLRALLVVIAATAVALTGAVPRAVAHETGVAHSGDWAVSANLPGGTWNGISQWVNYAADAEYQFSAWVRGSGTLAVNAQDGVSWDNLIWQAVTLTDDWTKVEGSFTVPASAAGMGVFRIVDSSDGGAQAFWVDDLSLTGPGGTEMLVNGGFEAEGSWDYPVGWSRVKNAPVVEVNDWAVSAHLTGGGTWGGIYQYVDLPANTGYQFSLRVKGTGKIAVSPQTPAWSDLTDVVTGEKVWQTIDLTPEWRTVTGGFTPNAEVGVFRVVDSSDDGDRTFWVDDLSLKGPDGVELLTNGGFESDNDAWGFPDGWTRTSLKATAPLGSFTDDDFSLVLDKSDNFGVDGSSPEKFNGDVARLSPGTTDPVWVSWQADVDITHVSLPVYKHADSPASELTLATSADGVTWRTLSVQEYLLANANQVAPEWPLWVTESTDFRPGDRYLKLTVEGKDPKAVSWATQIARVHVNSRVAAVQADPQPGFYDDAVTVTLSTTTPGARISYRIGDDGPQQAYTAPFTLGSGTVTAWATADGYVDSVTRRFAYASEADIRIDRYGQVRSAGYDKVTSDKELAADLAADEEYYGSLTPPADRDAYGGLNGSGAELGLTTTGFFHVESKDGRSILVSPQGNADFQLGLNLHGDVGDTATQVKGREQIYEWLPPYSNDPADPMSSAWFEGNDNKFSFYLANRARKTGKAWDQKEYYQEMTARAKKWGFTGAGGFTPATWADPSFPSVAFLDMPAALIPGTAKLYDIFKPGLEEQIDATFAVQLPKRVNDPALVGYMTFNEIDFDKIRTAIPGAKASQVGSKRALVDLLKERHDNDIASFNEAWNMSVASFDELYEKGFAPLTEGAVADMDAFTAVYLDEFYGLVAKVFRKYDPNHMLIGDRWLANVMNDPKLRVALATAAGRHLDALSYNYYAYDLDLKRIKEIYDAAGGTPLIFTEFHYAETTRGLVTGIRFANSELEKGQMYRNYVEKSAASGMVIGAHWFEAVDQAPTGRWYEGYGGEAGGIGLIDVTDRPYKVMLEQVMAANYGIYDVMLGKKQPYQHTFEPGQTERDSDKSTVIPRAAQPPAIDGVLDADWPEGPTLEVGELDRVLGIAKTGLKAQFRLAWDDENLYVHADVTDDTPQINGKKGWDIWNGDAIEMFIGPRNVDQGGAIQVLDSQVGVSASAGTDGKPEHFWFNNRADQPEIGKAVVATDHGWAVEVAVPLDKLNIDDPADGRKLRFDIGFDDAAVNNRERQFLWNGVDGNSSNREKWGRATLVDAVTPTDPTDPPEPPEPLPLATAVPTISGVATVGRTLTASPGAWGPAGVELAYQWFRSDVAIPGATGSSYLLAGADLGKVITVKVTGSMAGYVTASQTSGATTAVAKGTLTAVTPTITGSLKVGRTLTANAGDWGQPDVTFTHQWYRDGKKISKATKQDYKLTASDRGKRITVKVTGAKLGFDTISRTSAKTAKVGYGSLTKAAPTIKGKAKVGHKLTAKPGTWSPSGVKLKYQWYVNGHRIGHATKSSYTVRRADAGKRITVKVTGSKSGYKSTSATSARTSPVKRH